MREGLQRAEAGPAAGDSQPPLSLFILWHHLPRNQLMGWRGVRADRPLTEEREGGAVQQVQAEATIEGSRGQAGGAVVKHILGKYIEERSAAG